MENIFERLQDMPELGVMVIVLYLLALAWLSKHPDLGLGRKRKRHGK